MKQVTCIMRIPASGVRTLDRKAVDSFVVQTYDNKRLHIFNPGPAPVLTTTHPQITEVIDPAFSNDAAYVDAVKCVSKRTAVKFWHGDDIYAPTLLSVLMPAVTGDNGARLKYTCGVDITAGQAYVYSWPQQATSIYPVDYFDSHALDRVHYDDSVVDNAAAPLLQCLVYYPAHPLTREEFLLRLKPELSNSQQLPLMRSDVATLSAMLLNYGLEVVISDG